MSQSEEQFEVLTYEERELARIAAEKKRQEPEKSGEALNINSMMDMMTIILCFLLFNVGADPLNIKQNDDLRLPVSMSPYNPEATLSILVSQKQVVVDDRVVLELQEGDINDADLPGRNAMIVPELQGVLEQAVEKQSRINAQLGRESKSVATLIVDGRIPFKTVSRVMSSAQAGGVADLRFAVQRFGAENTYAGEGTTRVP